MELQEAVEIVESLAKGVDPVSGEVFSEGSPYNNPAIIRALFCVIGHMPKRKKSVEQRQGENLYRGLPKNTGLPWTDEARELVASSYRSGTKIDDLAKGQERSRTAIVAELKRQGVITAEEAARFGLPISN